MAAKLQPNAPFHGWYARYRSKAAVAAKHFKEPPIRYQTKFDFDLYIAMRQFSTENSMPIAEIVREACRQFILFHTESQI